MFIYLSLHSACCNRSQKLYAHIIRTCKRASSADLCVRACVRIIFLFYSTHTLFSLLLLFFFSCIHILFTVCVKVFYVRLAILGICILYTMCITHACIHLSIENHLSSYDCVSHFFFSSFFYKIQSFDKIAAAATTKATLR